MYFVPVFLRVLSMNKGEPTFLLFTPCPFLENNKPNLKKSLEIMQPPPEIHGIPYLSVPMYRASSKPAASIASINQFRSGFPLTFSTKIPITSVFADL